MKLKLNINSFKVNIFVVVIFNMYLIGLVSGPLLVNLFILSLLVIYLNYLKQINLFSIKNYNLSIKLQIIFCIYLVLNSFLIGDEIKLFYKSLFFFRFFLIAFVISQVLDFGRKALNTIIICFLIFSVFLGIDIFYQYLIGYDFFGYAPGLCTYPGGISNFDPNNCERFSGFFGKELIAGSFLTSYGLMFLYLFFSRFEKFKYVKIISLLFLIIILLAIILSGERNAILALVIIFMFNLIFNTKLRKKLILIASLIIIIFTILFNSVDNVKYRYFEWPIEYVDSMKSDGFKKLLDTSWGSHYVTSYEIFLDNKIFGSGFKSFRNECQNSKYKVQKLNEKYNLNMRETGCSSHPHNFYLELLSELGLVGFILFLMILYFIVFHPFIRNFKFIINESEIIIILSIVLTYLFPFKPTGSYSSSVFSTNLWFFIGFYLYFLNNLKYKTNNI